MRFSAAFKNVISLLIFGVEFFEINYAKKQGKLTEVKYLGIVWKFKDVLK